jgi:hypothetical protein
MKLKIDLSRQGNFILAILLIHFVFFGYLSQTFQKNIGEQILFLYQILFPIPFDDILLVDIFKYLIAIYPLIFLFLIAFILVSEGKFFEYGIRNIIWLTPLIIGQFFLWAWIIYGFNVTITILLADIFAFLIAIAPLIILFVIVFIMVSREKFFEYGIRNSIWLTPLIIGQSFIWFWIMYGFDVAIIGEFFTRYEGYVTVLSILGINLFAAILATILKQYREKMKQLELFKKERRVDEL